MTDAQHYRLLALLDHARQQVPRYADVLASASLKGFPVSERLDMVNHFEQHVSTPELTRVGALLHLAETPTEPWLDRYQVFQSAGADGRSAIFIYDEGMWHGTLLAYRHMLAGPIATAAFVGSADPRHTLFRVAKGLGAAPHQILGLQQPFRAVLAQLQELRPQTLIAYASALEPLAEAALAGQLHIDPQAIWAGTDWLTPESRQRCQEAFGVTPRTYFGMTELGVAAQECERGSLHAADHLHFEHDAGQLLATNVMNHVQPFIRYRMPDSVHLESGPCPCGRTDRRLQLHSGRLNNWGILPATGGGTTPVHPIALRSCLDPLPGLQGFALVWQERAVNLHAFGTTSRSIVFKAARNGLARAGVDIEQTTLKVTVSTGAQALKSNQPE